MLGEKINPIEITLLISYPYKEPTKDFKKELKSVISPQFPTKDLINSISLNDSTGTIETEIDDQEMIDPKAPMVIIIIEI